MNKIENDWLKKPAPIEKNETSELNEPSFEKVEGYILEAFASEEEMYVRMQQIREENANEAHGFTVTKDEKIGFYYQLGENVAAVEAKITTDNSWHSHPDVEISELLLPEENLPEDTPEDIRALREKYATTYDEIDEPSPKKPSLTDLINYLDNKRNKDLISMRGGVLVIDSLESAQSGLLQNYVKQVENFGKKLMAESTEISLWSFYRMQLQYLNYALSEFKSMLEKSGYEKMTDENILEVLDKIGFKFEFHHI